MRTSARERRAIKTVTGKAKDVGLLVAFYTAAVCLTAATRSNGR